MLVSIKLCKEDLSMNIFKLKQEIYDIYFQSKYMADFRNLPVKLEM